MIRKLTVALAASAALFVVAAAHPTPAAASFKVCNQSGESVSVAVAYHDADSGSWVSRGWWNIGDGECKTPIGGDLKNQYYYLYGDGDQHTWTGSHEFCVDNDKAFTLDESDNVCDYAWESFFEINTGDLTTYTYTFK